MSEEEMENNVVSAVLEHIEARGQGEVRKQRSK